MKKIEIEIPDGYEFDKETMSIVPIKDTMKYVDLGLPSGTLWATSNIGASKPEEYGDYLKFDEAQRYNCPSKEQFEELIQECSWIWCSINEVNGYLVLGKNGNHIFLPAGGCVSDRSIGNVNVIGHYWSNSSAAWKDTSWYLCLDSDNYSMYHYYRDRGRSIRSVKNS